MVAALGSTFAARASADTLEATAQAKLITELLVPAREAGVVMKLLVHPGDVVKKDDPLVQLDDRLIRLQREAALVEAELAEMDSHNDVDLRFAEKSEAVARAELERMLQANRDYERSISRTELQQTKLSAERSSLAAEQATRDLDSKRLTVDLRCKQVKLLTMRLEMMMALAPVDGLVIDLDQAPQEGEFVQAGAPVLRMIQLNPLRVEGLLDARRFDQSLEGAPVIFHVPLPPGGTMTEFHGKVTFVSPEIDPVDSQIRFWAEIENPEFKLRPGSRGKLIIDLSANR